MMPSAPRWDMAWAIPQHTRQEVNVAGDCLVADTQLSAVMDHDEMLAVINNWRSSHSFPLQSFKMTLLRRAKKVDKHAIVAQRLKRLSSISAKLHRFPDMKLSQMQDIGGCRAVVENIAGLEELVKLYTKGRSKNPTKRHEFLNSKDYILNPKGDGYRGVHLIYRYRSSSKKHGFYSGLKIEIQLRSKLQHAWATAVETVSFFTGQALKASAGEAEWHRFFSLMSSSLALRERQPIVPDTPPSKSELVDELRLLTTKLNVVNALHGWSFALRQLPAKNVTDAVAFLIVLDTVAYTLATTGFKKEELPKASEAYLAVEKATASNPGIQAVLVSLDSVHAIRTAYPNYFLDTNAFVTALKIAIR
jgi:ppGpp synthetase/RelA/SpoT-type nucleotidyltranferase